MNRRLITVLSATLLLAGCVTTPVTTATLTYETVPPGAQLYEGTTELGVAPVTRTYNGDPKTGTLETPDVKAVWPSGASTSFFTVLPLGADRVATLERPKGAPGLEQDVENGRKVAAAQKLEADRKRALEHSDLARASDRCKLQTAQGNKGLTDDCR